jgi:hypothetical protein
MVNRPFRADDDPVSTSEPSPAAVRCLDCAFAWHSPLMADGLRALGSCPKCGGTLEFAEAAPPPKAPAAPRMDLRAPHLVLGLPRR